MTRPRELLNVGVGAVRHFTEDHCANHAAAISFFALLSLFPLVLLALIVLAGVFGSDPEHIDWVAGLFQRPGAEIDPKILGALEASSELRGSFALPLAATLIYSATHVFAAVQRANRRIFQVRGRGGFLRARLRSLALATSLVGLLVVLFAVHQAARALAGWSRPIADAVTPPAFLATVAARTVPLTLAFLLFSALFHVLPELRIAGRAALIGGAVVAVGWEVLKIGFGAYVAAVPRFGVVYGPLATMVVFLVWLYLVSCIFLLGGEIVAILNGNRRAFDSAGPAC